MNEINLVCRCDVLLSCVLTEVATATSNAALREQLKTLTSSQSVSSSELESLKTRVEDTEREKRDLVNVISRLKQEGTQQEGMS